MLVVDAANVVGSRPTGWWRDRAGAARRLVAELAAFAARTGDEVMIVFDGRPVPGMADGTSEGVQVSYATRAGRNAGDDRIVEQITRDDDPSSLTVITSDRDLAQRARALGAHVEGASALTRELGWKHP